MFRCQNYKNIKLQRDVGLLVLPNCTDEIPPQADMKSPPSFSSGEHGEWSDTTKSILPDLRWSHKSSWKKIHFCIKVISWKMSIPSIPKYIY